MEGIVSVKIKKGRLRHRASFLGKVILTVDYGSKVKVISQQGSWLKVQYISNQGWLHKSALTEKKVVIRAGTEDVKKAANDDEMVLAGKGFSEKIEGEYRRRNPKANFHAIDQIEKLTVAPAALKDFLKQGSLKS